MYELDGIQTHHGHDDYAEKKEKKASLRREGVFREGGKMNDGQY